MGQYRPVRLAVKVAAPIGIKTADFSVQNGVLRSNGVRELLRQLRPRFQDVTIPRDEAAMMPLDVRQSAEPVDLWLEDAGGMIDRVRRVTR